MDNPYLPYPVTVKNVRVENAEKDLKTFTLTFDHEGDREKFDFVCGQFGMLSIYGAGECPIGIASSPLDRDFVQFTVKRYPSGVVTSALHNLDVGSAMGVRTHPGDTRLTRIRGASSWARDWTRPHSAALEPA